MKKGPKIIQISGFQGLFFMGFVAVCLFAGFVLFPARVAMHLWNHIASTYYVIPAINIWQGIMLWAIVALSTYIITKGNHPVSFKQPMELNDTEMRILMERIKMQQQARNLNTMIIKAKDLEITSQDNSKSQENKDEQTPNNINEKQL